MIFGTAILQTLSLAEEKRLLGTHTTSNVFPRKGINSEPAVIPVELAATTIRMFGFKGQWVLDLARSNGEFNYLLIYLR